MDVKQSINEISEYGAIVFDFDGVFTNNKVVLDERGTESVVCSRYDGFGIQLLRKYAERINWDVDFLILSTEKNPVVSRRGEKLGIRVEQGVEDKVRFLKSYQQSLISSSSLSGHKIIYLGNDLNDYKAMLFCGLSIAPSDAHPIIKEIADVVLLQKGGDGFVREFVESLIGSTEILINLIDNLD